jgi:hypothetical protein
MLGGVVNFGCFFMYCQRKFTLMVLICSAIWFFVSLYPNRFLTQTHAPSEQSMSIRQTSFGTIFRDGKCCFGAIQHFCVTKQTAIVTLYYRQKANLDLHQHRKVAIPKRRRRIPRNNRSQSKRSLNAA